MAIRVVDARGVPLTRELAAAHAALAPMPGEREVKATRIKFLKDLIERHLFFGPSWHQGRCLADGVMYRLDGQHSSISLLDLEESDFPMGLLAQVVTWEFDSKDDAAELFNAFNNPRSGRSNEDMMGVYRAGIPELAHLSRKFLINVANGVDLRESQKWEDGNEDALKPHGPRERGLYFFHPGPVQVAGWLSRFRTMKNAAFLTQPVIVAEMIAQWEANSVLATTFWDLVFSESHPDVDHETRELAETYRDWAIKKKTRAPQYRAKANKAWKTFIKSTPEGQALAMAAGVATDAPDATDAAAV